MALTQHPLGRLLRPYSASEYDELLASVRVHGLQDPRVLLFEGQVLDGWHRYRAAVEAGQPSVTETYDGDDPVGVVMRANAVRRHLTPTERAAAFVAARAALEAAGASRRQDGRPREHKTKQSDKPIKNQRDKTGPNGPVSETPSNTEGAQQIGVGRKTVDRAEQARSTTTTRVTATPTKKKTRPSKTEQLTAEMEQLSQDVTLWRQRAEAAESKARLLEQQASPNAQARLAEWNNQRAEIQGLTAELSQTRTRDQDTIRRLRAEIRVLKEEIRRLTGRAV